MRLGTARIDEELLEVTAIALVDGVFRVRAEGRVRHRVDSGRHVVVLYDLDGGEVSAAPVDLDMDATHAGPNDYLRLTVNVEVQSANGWDRQ